MDIEGRGRRDRAAGETSPVQKDRARECPVRDHKPEASEGGLRGWQNAFKKLPQRDPANSRNQGRYGSPLLRQILKNVK